MTSSSCQARSEYLRSLRRYLVQNRIRLLLQAFDDIPKRVELMEEAGTFPKQHAGQQAVLQSDSLGQSIHESWRVKGELRSAGFQSGIRDP